MGNGTQQAALPPVIVHGAEAANARRRVAALLEAAGARPDEVGNLIATIEAGAVEGTSEEIAANPAPAGASAEFAKGWHACIASATSTLARISDRTIRQAQEATRAPSPTLPPAPAPVARLVPGVVDDAGRERILEAAEQIYVSVTGYTEFDRDLSLEVLPVVLRCLSADEQDGYVRQLQAFAETNRERLATLYAGYGPGGTSEDESRCYLTHQPESIVVCERLSTVPMLLDAVWNEELDAEMVLERFTTYWRFGST